MSARDAESAAAHDDTERQRIAEARVKTGDFIARLMMAYTGFAAFCIFTLLSPDRPMIDTQASLNMPFAGAVSFLAFMLLTPVVLIGMRVYLEVYVRRWRQLDAELEPGSEPKTVSPLKHPLLRIFSAFVLYPLLPALLVLFTWKAAAKDVWGEVFLLLTVVCAVAQVYQIVWWHWSLRAAQVAAVSGYLFVFVIVGVLYEWGLPHRGLALNGEDLKAAYLVGEDLRLAALVGANLRGANLTSTDLTDANLSRANLTDASLMGANLTNANLADANLTHADLFGANLTGANLEGANLTDANLRIANLTDADLRFSNLTDAVIFGANLRRADLSSTRLGGADFDCMLQDDGHDKFTPICADLQEANLTWAMLAHANLADANLADANLTDANLTDANLTGANLTGANLTGANLTHAILMGAKVTQHQLDSACISKGGPPTTLPDGLQPPQKVCEWYYREIIQF